MKGADAPLMTDTKQNTRQDATAPNPNAVSVRIEPKAMAKAKFQRRHDFRIGCQPAYVDGDRSELNRHLMELRPLPDIQRENEALRKRAGRTRKMKSNAAVITAGIITFGHAAQEVFNRLPQEVQDRAFTELAQEIAAQMKTSLEALVVHLDETAIHAHFTMRAYNDDGEPISNATRLGDLAALQDLAAVVMQRYAPEIERGNKKKARLEAGANYPDTLHRTVKQLHEDLPREKAALEAEAIEVEKQAVRAERQKVQEQMTAARAAKETYDRGIDAIEAVLTEAESETLVYNPDTGETAMQDPTPLKDTPPKLRTQIIKLAKRLAFVESNLFARIFRLDEQISRIRAFLTRNDIEPETKIEAQEIIDDAAGEEPGLG
jgi:hypothetical protein